ncbi:MAG: hypothetical protein JXX28_19305 [Deltaproteobacteria bacterium]|nr:hypothetical protein [Deltaproteobacteria bacterium]
MSQELIWSGGHRAGSAGEGAVTSVGVGVGSTAPPPPKPLSQRRMERPSFLEKEPDGGGFKVDLGRIEPARDETGTRPVGRIPMRSY